MAETLSEKLGTKVEVGRVDIRLFNRFIIDEMSIYDKEQKQMLRVARVSAAIDIMPLFDGEVSISSAQLFGMRANIYKKDSTSPLNCQFVIDSLKPKPEQPKKPLNLAIASLIIRHGNIEYNQLDKPVSNGRFSPYHLSLSEVSSHIIINRLTDTSCDASVKKLAFKEASGLQVDNLTMDACYKDDKITVSDVVLKMPQTSLNIPSFTASFKKNDGRILTRSLSADCTINAERITVKDFSAFLSPDIIKAIPTLSLQAKTKLQDGNATVDVVAVSQSEEGGRKPLEVNALITVADIFDNATGNVNIRRLYAAEDVIHSLNTAYNIPEEICRLGSVEAEGTLTMAGKRHFLTTAKIETSKVGKLDINAEYNQNTLSAKIKTPLLNVAQVLDDNNFGILKCDVDLKAQTNDAGKPLMAVMKGNIDEVTYNKYTYRDIDIDATYNNNTISGMLSILDPNITIDAKGKATFGAQKDVNATVVVKNFNPKALNLADRFGENTYALDVEANMHGTTIDNALGKVNINELHITNPRNSEKNLDISNVSLNIERNEEHGKRATLYSEYATVELDGDFELTKIPYSICKIVKSELTTLPLLKQLQSDNNNFTIHARVDNINKVNGIMNMPLTINAPVELDGYINSPIDNCSLRLSAPDITISGAHLSNTLLEIVSPGDYVTGKLTTLLHDKNGTSSLTIDNKADNNRLQSVLSWDNNRENIFRGKVKATTLFSSNPANGNSVMDVTFNDSHFYVGPSEWDIKTEGIHYEEGRMVINDMRIGNDEQYIALNGATSQAVSDSIVASLHNINVENVFNLINFHNVNFYGNASGDFIARNIMTAPQASGSLKVTSFEFERGRMGTLYADAKYDNESKNIDIDAVADDPDYGAKTFITGFISPIRQELDLNIKARDTRLEFLEHYCRIMTDTDLRGNGEVRIFGGFKTVDMTGMAYAKGEVSVKGTNCRYYLPADTVRFESGDMQFDKLPIYDKFGNYAYLDGNIRHSYLNRVTFDLDINTKKLLVFNCPPSGSSFGGYVVIGGEINLEGSGNEVNITGEATTMKDTYVSFNVLSPETITSQDFITWGSATEKANSVEVAEQKTVAKADSQKPEEANDINNSGNKSTNIRANLMVTATPDAKLHLIMDPVSGDYIDLYGNGALRVNYYNKGATNVFGNYNVETGTYRMTIQNLLRREFKFQKGGSLAFGGDPFNAALNLQAAYMLNSVSLADLSIGSSFKSNNVPVNCLMNITGTAFKPEVTFDLALPSLSNEASQMVYSLINSAEEMNQQVLYLLAIGRFYQPSSINSDDTRTGQTTLAMQSFISGTVSQKLNQILNQYIGNNNWTVGANITPGADGFNNAEYEGLLSGKMFNNRLIFNGQFGYRDNISTNSQSFIGDFSLKYLLTPNGNIALKAYNQTNDRYFTRNSLNTQGIGVIFQKEFGK